MNHIPTRLPIECPTDAEALSDFNQLCSYTPRLKEGEWCSRSAGLEVMHPYTLPIDRVGMLSSNRFHFSARMACDSANSPSVVRNWYIQKFRKSLESSEFYEKSPKTALALRKYIPSQFRPASAKTVFEVFKAKKIYDPCMGWGDRLSGALASKAEFYYGRDVNPFLFAGYSEQVRRLDSSTEVCVEMVGAETGCPEQDFFDLVFTSPPYYKAEKYAGELQSHVKFKGIDSWLKGFLFPMAAHSLNSIHEDGFVAINISDVYVDHRQNEICRPLIEFMRSIGATYEGAFGYELGKRINKNNMDSQKKGFAEPILVFSKQKEGRLVRILTSNANQLCFTSL